MKAHVADVYREQTVLKGRREFMHTSREKFS